MWRNHLKQITKFALIAVLLIPILLPAESHAQVYEGVRDMHWSSSLNRCIGGGYSESRKQHSADVLDFNPFANNPDLAWDISNGVCAAYVASSSALILTTMYVMSWACNDIAASTIYSASVAAGVPLSPQMVKDQAKSSAYCATQAIACYNPVTAAVACPIAGACCVGAALNAAAVSAAVTALAIIYGVANGAYQKARVCGYDDNNHPWKSWTTVDSNGNTVSTGGTWKKGAYSDSYKKIVQDNITSGAVPNLKDKKYREYIFGGIEYEDNGDHACGMPDWSNTTKDSVLGYHDKKNLVYYMTGSNEAPVFACYRFLLSKGSDAEVAAGKAAYDCCNKRSQNVICIENAPNVVGPAGDDYKHVFCEIGQRCNVNGVWYDAYVAQTKSNYVCARTYSGCPYNHPLGGGTEKADYSDPDDQATLQNYCQYMNHCQILPIQPYVVQSGLTGSFFDSSCRDMKGDSQNTYGYSSNLTPVDVRGFSAPMAQCFKETIQNIFFNRAGSTACLDPKEVPNGNGVCSSGYRYKKGDDLSAYQKSIGKSGNSFFVRVQTALQNTIRMALSMAIMFFGVSILIGGGGITKKQIIPFIVKIAFVMYFATGNEWQSWVLNGVLDGSAELSDIMFRTDSLTGTTSSNVNDGTGQIITKYVTDASVDQTKLDGCQFPRYNYADTNESTKYNYAAYPPGKEYLRIWDTLDCKISRALGYGVEVSVPNLVMMILGGFLTGGAGVIFVVATFAFAFCLIALTIRALHIFILSTIAIIILFYVSPITITMIMFGKTKDIFKKWWENVLSFALQPMVLFAYLGIFLTLFDNVIMGDVSFIGDGKNVPKTVSCAGAAANTSVYCIFNMPISGEGGEVKTNDQLKILGLGLPVLANMNQTKISSLIKAGVLLFILLSFMDKISDLAKSLVGGNAALTSNTMKASDMMSKAHGAASAIQQRGMGALKKHGGAMAKKGMGAARGAISAMGDRGTSAKAGAGRTENKEGSAHFGGGKEGGGSSGSGG
jgi:type IV secretory pathway VirB6-like protein